MGGCCGQSGAIPGHKGWTPPTANVGYDLSGAMLRHIYDNAAAPHSRWQGGVRPKSAFVERHLLRFDQSEFVPAGCNLSSIGLADDGFVYLPAACQAPLGSAQSCAAANRVHVHYHPCGGEVIGVSTSYMLQSGTADYAESNGLLVLFPQTTRYGIYGSGCWDWSGGVSADFDTHRGIQLNVVMAMLGRLGSLVGGASWP